MASRLWQWAAAICLFLAVTETVSATFELVDNGKVATLNGIHYYVGGIAVSQLETVNNTILGQSLSPGLDIFPLTVIRTTNDYLTGDEFTTVINRFSTDDDVFQEGFLHAIYLAHDGTGNSSFSNGSSLTSTLEASGTSLFLSSNFGQGALKTTLTQEIPNGPYFASATTGEIFKAFRLYPDDNMAFIQAAISDEADGFLALPATTENVMTKAVAVPSRLYYTVSEDQPLAGLRLGVKDIYHVKGLRTSGGNRAYYYLHGPQNITAPSIQRLIDQGAVFVGKLGTVQFANGDSPTADWVDLHCPYNPRGDGYQSPSGSSSGSGAAIGAYDWLDIAVGSDTGGSMRGPAGSQGLFGNRPSTGAVPMDHVIPLSPVLDTAGVFARSAATWSTVAHAWYQDFSSNYSSYPKSLLWAETGSGWGSTTRRPEVAAIFEDFVAKVENFLQVNRTLANVTQQWIDTRTDETPENLNEMLYLPYGIITSRDQFELHGQPFFDEYSAVHNGRQPFINPVVLARWNFGQVNSSEAQYQESLQNMTIFSDWWSTQGYGRSNAESCSESLYIYPWSEGETDYRNRYFLQRTTPPFGFADWAIAGYAGAADLVVPLGEVRYNSTISLKEEYLPVTASILVARGCDLMLANLVKDLEDAGILKPVATGPMLYP